MVSIQSSRYSYSCKELKVCACFASFANNDADSSEDEAKAPIFSVLIERS